MFQFCHCEAPQGPWQSRRTVLNFRKISANSKHFTGDSHVASLLGMTKRRLFAIPRIPRCFPLVFPPKPPAGQLFRQPVSQKRNVPPGKPDGTFRRKERKREKKRKSMKKRGGAIYGRHRIRAGDCPARTAPAHWPMLLALRSAPHRPCCQTRWAGGTSCRSARW